MVTVGIKATLIHRGLIYAIIISDITLLHSFTIKPAIRKYTGRLKNVILLLNNSMAFTFKHSVTEKTGMHLFSGAIHKHNLAHSPAEGAGHLAFECNSLGLVAGQDHISLNHPAICKLTLLGPAWLVYLASSIKFAINEGSQVTGLPVIAIHAIAEPHAFLDVWRLEGACLVRACRHFLAVFV